MGLYRLNEYYNIGTLCGRNSSETTERILLKFCMIVRHHMQLFISFRHFDSTNFTGVMGLYRLNAYYNIGTLCGRNSSETIERILLKFCTIVCHHMQLIISCRYFDSTNFTGVMGLYRLNAYHNIGTLCGRNSISTQGCSSKSYEGRGEGTFLAREPHPTISEKNAFPPVPHMF